MENLPFILFPEVQGDVLPEIEVTGEDEMLLDVYGDPGVVPRRGQRDKRSARRGTSRFNTLLASLSVFCQSLHIRFDGRQAG